MSRMAPPQLCRRPVCPNMNSYRAWPQHRPSTYISCLTRGRLRRPVRSLTGVFRVSAVPYLPLARCAEAKNKYYPIPSDGAAW
eukprot:5608171-Heterocapsa_arctica.AAC.1